MKKLLAISLFTYSIFATSPTSTGNTVTVPEANVTGSYLENQVFSTGASMQMSAEVTFDVLASHQTLGMTDINASSGNPIYIGEINVYATEIKNQILDIQNNGGTVRKLNCSLIKSQSGEADTLSHSAFSLNVPEQGFDCELFYNGTDFKIRMKGLIIVAIENYNGPASRITFQRGDNDGLTASRSHRVTDLIMVNDTYNPSLDVDTDIFSKNNSQNTSINDFLSFNETVSSAQSALLMRFEYDLTELRNDVVQGLSTTAFSGNEIEVLWQYDGI